MLKQIDPCILGKGIYKCNIEGVSTTRLCMWWPSQVSMYKLKKIVYLVLYNGTYNLCDLPRQHELKNHVTLYYSLKRYIIEESYVYP